MNKPRLPIAFLVVALTLADLVVGLIVSPSTLPRPEFSGWIVALCQAMAYSQVALVAVWLILGGGARWATFRLAAAWPVVAFWGRLWAAAHCPPDPWLWERAAASATMMLLSMAVVVIVPLGAARYAGLALADVESTDSRCRPPQFSLSVLMVWVLGLAVFFGLLSWFTRFDGFRQLPLKDVVPLVAAGFGQGAIALACMWAVLGRRWPLLRLAVMLVVVGSVWSLHAAAVYWALDAGRSLDYREMSRFLLVVALHVGWLLLSFSAVRLAGLRLCWRRVAAELPPSISSPG